MRLNDNATGYTPICNVCKHYIRDASITCKAYPKGIPSAVLNGSADHTKPYKGDHGIQFAPRDEK